MIATTTLETLADMPQAIVESSIPWFAIAFILTFCVILLKRTFHG